MQFVGMPLNDGQVQPQLAGHPLLHITAGEGPDALRDLLPERVLREFEEERTFGRFLGHAVGSGARPHKERRLLRFASPCLADSFHLAARTRRPEAWPGGRFPPRSSPWAQATGPGSRDFGPSMWSKKRRSDW